MVVRYEHPSKVRRRLQWLSLSAVILFALGFFSGRLTVRETTVSLDAAESEQLIQLVKLQMAHDVDQQAISVLRNDLAEDRTRISELERELAFYREVMAPEDLAQGVVIRTPKFEFLSPPNRWRYQLAIQQGGRIKNAQIGSLAVTLFGEADEVAQSYDLHDVDVELMGVKPTLSFRYFQRFDGEFFMPADFKPTHIIVRAEMSKPINKVVEKRYNWSYLTTSQ